MHQRASKWAVHGACSFYMCSFYNLNYLYLILCMILESSFKTYARISLSLFSIFLRVCIIHSKFLVKQSILQLRCPWRSVCIDTLGWRSYNPLNIKVAKGINQVCVSGVGFIHNPIGSKGNGNFHNITYL